MAADPDELLIFQLRPKRITGAVASALSEQQLQKPHPEQPILLGKPKEAPEKPDVSRSEPKYAITQAKGLERQAPPQPALKPVRAPPPELQTPGPNKGAQEEGTVYGVPNYPNPINYYVPEKPVDNLEEYNETYKKKLEVRSKAQSRATAKKLFCAWHPWRRAYAICSYCHRPFCYEDMAEYKEGYYCLEDVNAVMHSYLQKLHSAYNKTNMIAAIILVSAFLFFLYNTKGQLAYILNYASTLGPVMFVESIKWAYIMILMELAVMVASLAIALYATGRSRRGNVLGILIGVIGVVFFTYLYIPTGTQYLAITAGLEFLAFLAFVYSAAAEARVYEQQEINPESYNMLLWPNVSKF
jgi:hypothetical protein